MNSQLDGLRTLIPWDGCFLHARPLVSPVGSVPFVGDPMGAQPCGGGGLIQMAAAMYRLTQTTYKWIHQLWVMHKCCHWGGMQFGIQERCDIIVGTAMPTQQHG